MLVKGLKDDQIEEVLNKYELCLSRVPGFYAILSEIQEQKPLETGLIEKYSAWTGRTDEICHLLSENDPNGMVALEQILVFSSIMEFSLGNVNKLLSQIY